MSTDFGLSEPVPEATGVSGEVLVQRAAQVIHSPTMQFGMQSVELSGPFITRPGCQVIAKSHDVDLVVGRDEIVDLVSALNAVSRDVWAAAVLDDGQIVVTSNRAAGYISPGVHLPHNVILITGNGVADGVFWQVYGWPPVERLVTYARHFGWLNRITTLVVEQTPPRWSDTERRKVPTDVFEWVRPVLDHHDVELIEFDSIKRNRELASVRLCELLVHGPDSESFQKGRERLLQPPLVSAPRGGRHRLDTINPDRYQDLVQRTADGRAVVVLEDLATVTVKAAQAALAGGELAFTDNSHHDSAQLQKQILEIVAATDPADIANRRLETLTSPDMFIGHNTSEAIGFPITAAPAWAEYVGAAYGGFLGGARSQAKHRARIHYEIVSGHWPHAADAADAVNHYASAELVAVALEAILLWTVDPLPVADIEYATRAILG